MRAIVVVMDSAGIGELPDANKYGDVGSNTICNIVKHRQNIKIQNLINLGIGNIDGAVNLKTTDKATGCFGKMAEVSKGKDTTVGHYELAGLFTEEAFPTYPNGFPDDVVERFEKCIGTKIIGNCVASGTAILEKLGEEHIKTGFPIVYTSADSVFQVAAHEDVFSIKELYRMCELAREVLGKEHNVARIIARPFKGAVGNFERTTNRRDFALEPHGKTMLNCIKEAKQTVAAVGKIEDIFSGSGVTESVHTKSNMDGVDKTLDYMKTVEKGLIFTNLVEFDMNFGHRNDVEGYANALEEFDVRIPELINAMKDEDILFITADHGCDPTILTSTDHSREYVPVLVYGKKIKNNINLGIRKSFADMSATILEYLEVENKVEGTSFLDKIKD